MNRRDLSLLVRHAVVALLLVWCGMAQAAEMDEDRPIGAVGGAVHADPFTGVATTSIPIQVPPGRNGIQPNLQLVYESAAGNGWIGMGWKLELGAIERQTRFGVDYSGDAYTARLNGASTDLTTLGGGDYRAKLEGGFTRFRKLTATDGKPYWEATDRKGTRYLFGQATASRMADPADPGRIFKWCLDRIEDTNGNFMTMTYVGDQGQGYLSQIDYTGNGATLPTNQVKFYLEGRSDAPPMYLVNYLVTTAKRLKTIEVLANGTPVRTYQLSYLSSPGTTRSLLSTVQQFGMNTAASLPALTIGYQASSSSFTAPYVATGFCGSSWKLGTGDFNGDGKTDVYCWAGSDVSVALSTDHNFAGPYVATGFCGSSWKLGTGDFNGDGKIDLSCHADANVSVTLSSGSSFTAPYAVTGFCGSSWLVGTGDFNGDGKIDLSCHADANVSVTIAGSTAEMNNLANSIANGLGNHTTITYTSSMQYINTFLPFPVQRVNAITTNDGNGNVATTSYTYSGGFYHIEERDLRGVNYAKITGPVGPNGEQAIAETWFHQGNDTTVDVNNPYVAHGYMKGKPYRTKITNGSGAVLTETTVSYATDVDGVAPFFTPPQDVTTTICDGTACGKQVRTVSTYDGYGNVTREDHYGDLNDSADDRTVVRTFVLNTTAWIVGLPASETLYQGIGTSPQVAQTTFYYDGTASCSTASTNQTPTQGNLTRVVRWLSGSTAPEARMAYDSYGNRTCTRDANGNTTTVTYDASFTFPKIVTNALGHQATTQYYGVDGVAATTGLYGQVKSVTDPNGAVTAIEYDALGRKTKATNPDGFWATIAYNSLGTVGSQHVRTDSSLGLSSWSYFDGLGRPTKKKSTGPDSKVTVTDTQYNVRGAVLKTSLPYFEGTGSPLWKTFIYDPVGRITRTDNPDASRILACNDDWVSVTIDADNHRKRETRDVAGRLIRVDEYQGTFTTCDLAVGTPYATTTYQYDRLGSLRFVTDAKGNQTQMQYDTLSRKIAMHDPDMGDWTYAYDAAGNLTQQIDAKSQAIFFQYDALNRRRQKDHGTQKALGSGDVVYTYDGTSYNRQGRLQQVQDSSGPVSFQYDVAGRTIRTDKTIGSTTYTTQSAYDGLGRMTSVTYPDNSTVTNSFNGPLLQQVAEGTTTYAQYTGYNALGQPSTLTLGNGVVTTYTYQANTFRLASLNTVSGSTTLQNLGYSYDSGGNVTALTDAVNGNQAFSYDEIDRLLTATGPYGSLTYNYDQIGNMTANSQVGSYVYPASGSTSAQPHAVNTAGSNSYTYDANGNLTAGAGRTISYDPENRPISVTQSGTTTTFSYNGEGRRVSKTVGQTTTTYVSTLYECETVNATTQCTKYIFANSQRIAMKQVTNGMVDYYHPDHLGSSSVMTTASGVQEQTLAYYPYGAVRTNNGSIDVPHKFTGKELDASTGLYFYEARYYDATLGRFISADTIVPNPRDPQDLNRYTYANNNPLRYTDPTGHFSFNIAKFFRHLFTPCSNQRCGTDNTKMELPKGTTLPIVAAIASAFCGGCGAIFGGSAIATGAVGGAVAGAAVGGLSAAEHGGNILHGVLMGAALGGVTGGTAGALSSLGGTIPQGLNFSMPGMSNMAQFSGAHIAAGAVVGVGTGVTQAYGGGAGNWNSILRGALEGAEWGLILGAATAGAEFAGRNIPGPVSDTIEVLTGFKGQFDTLLDTANKSGVLTMIEVSALSVGTGIELSNQHISQWIDRDLLKKGGHCNASADGVSCGRGVEQVPPPNLRKVPEVLLESNRH